MLGGLSLKTLNTAIRGALQALGSLGLTTLNVSGSTALGPTTITGAASVSGALTASALLDLSAAGAGQIKFPNTQNPSADVNTLDDYEEGTWTPNVGGSATYIAQTGYYTKIGRIIHLQAQMTINVLGTGNNHEVLGIPFTANGLNHTFATSSWSSLSVTPVFLCGNISVGAPDRIAINGITAASASMGGLVCLQNNSLVKFDGIYW